MTPEDRLNELKHKIISLEIHLQNTTKDSEKLEDSLKEAHDKDVHRIEGSIKDLYENIKDIYDKINGQRTDINSAVFQFKSVIKEFTELTIDVKEVKKITDTLNVDVGVCKVDRDNADILKFIKNKPARALTIFLIIGVMLLLAILFGNPSLILKPLGVG